MVRVPNKTSVFKNEPVHKEKDVFGFADELIQFILTGEKVTTYKFGHKKDYLVPGNTVIIKNSVTNKVIGKAIILKKKKTTFVKLPMNIAGHETYKNKEHQRKVFSGYYAYLGRELQDNDPFLIFEFQLLKT